jgi:hypothetical protein
LLRSFQDDGFIVPVALWQRGDNQFTLLDGHQRLRVLTQEKIEFENTGFMIPFFLIEADNEIDARKKLLKISSQYGTITIEGFDEFTAEIPDWEPMEYTTFDALSWMNGSEQKFENKEIDPEELIDKEHVITCPRCKFQFEKK